MTTIGNKNTEAIYLLAAAVMHNITPGDVDGLRHLYSDSPLPPPERTIKEKIDGTGLGFPEDDLDRFERMSDALASVLSLRGGLSDRHLARPRTRDAYLVARAVTDDGLSNIATAANALLGWDYSAAELRALAARRVSGGVPKVDAFLADFARRTAAAA